VAIFEWKYKQAGTRRFRFDVQSRSGLNSERLQLGGNKIFRWGFFDDRVLRGVECTVLDRRKSTGRSYDRVRRVGEYRPRFVPSIRNSLKGLSSVICW
jgi:hypothetical protein